MNKSDSITKLMPALIRAKLNFAPAVKSRKNDFFKSKYVPLDVVIDVTEHALLNEGLVIIQTTLVEGAISVLQTSLVHESGEFISGNYLLKPVKDDPQGHGSAMTYARRYCMMAILGIAPEDDDGNAASGNAEAKAVTFGSTKAEKSARQADENAKLVAAGQEPAHSVDDKAAAAESYKRLAAVDPEQAKLIKHNHGTDYAAMKIKFDLAYRTIHEGAA